MKNVYMRVSKSNKNIRLILALTLIISLLNACKENYTSTDYLKKVLNHLEKIESATYATVSENWNPADTAASDIYYSFVKEFNNPSDTTIGAKFVTLNPNDTSKLEFCYDGQMRALVYNEEKRIVLDSVTVRPLPFRPLPPTFFLNFLTTPKRNEPKFFFLLLYHFSSLHNYIYHFHTHSTY